MSKRNSLLSSEHADPPKQYADDPEVVHDGFDKQAYTPEEPKYLAPNQDPPEVDERQPLEPDQNYRDSTYPHYAEQSPRTICGLRRKTFIILSAIIALLIIFGVGLGAGLGVGLKKSSTNDSESANSSPNTSNPKSNTKASPLRVIENTGLALTPLADGTGLLLYYQLPNKTIIEAFHPNTSLTSTSLTNSSANSPLLAQTTTQIPTPNILQASPLTAVSFLRNGSPFRALFYISNDGLIQTTNSTSLTSPWSSPAPIDPRVATSGTPALATCYFPGVGLRVYFGQFDGGFITKLENGFELTDGSASRGWHDAITLEQISAQGGVACTGMYERNGKMVEDVYARNVSAAGANVVHMVDNKTDTIFGEFYLFFFLRGQWLTAYLQCRYKRWPRRGCSWVMRAR